MRRLSSYLLLAMLVVPMSLHAVTFNSLVELADTLAGGVVRSLGFLLLTLAVVAFFWGMVQFIWNARQGNSGKGMENGKQFMLWGLIALFVMFSVWGIIQWAQSVLDIRGQTSIVIPRIRMLGSPNTGSPSSGSGACPSGQTRNAAGSCVNTTVPTGECAGMTEIQRTNCFKALPTCNNLTEIQRNACLAAKADGATSDPSCQNKTVNDPCTTTDATGASVTGFCNNAYQCVPSRGASGCFAPQVPRQGGTPGCVKPGDPCTNISGNGQTTTANGTYDQNGACVSANSNDCSGMTEAQRATCLQAQSGTGGGTTPTPGGVGATCNVGADCASGLLCHPATKKCQ